MAGSYTIPVGPTPVVMMVVNDAAWTEPVIDNIKITIESKPKIFQTLAFICIP